MALIQKRFKQNDFLFASRSAYSKTDPGSMFAGVLVHTIGNVGNYLRDIRDTDHVYAYHAEKQRAKFTQKKVRTGGKDTDKVMQTQSTKVREGKWVVRLFKIPVDKVKSIKQHKRHFVLEMK
jgi:hypothetical protein